MLRGPEGQGAAVERLRPEIAFDLDGVIARPPLGVNLAISRRLNLPPLPSSIERHDVSPSGVRRIRWLLWAGMEAARYGGRRPMPDARAGLAAISDYRSPVIVTGRSWVGRWLIDAWLRRHGMRELLGDLLPNDTALPSAHHKLATARRRGIEEHVDDDGSIVFFLATHGMRTVYLRQWRRNRGLPYPSNVHVFRSLEEIAQELGRED